jgi:5'-nucleotidase
VIPGSITLDGIAIDAATEVRVTMNVFLADGGDGFSALRGSKDRVGGTVDLEALERYLAAHQPVGLPAGGRVVKVTTQP